MDIEAINNSISDLESGDTTVSACEKLAHLYIIREHITNENKAGLSRIRGEFSDILPSYIKYVETKKQYQQHKTSLEDVEYCMSTLCKDICEFIHILYNSTESSVERKCISSTIYNISKEF